MLTSSTAKILVAPILSLVIALLGIVSMGLDIMARRKMGPADWGALRFEIGELFTPSSPVGTAELFAGRQKQIMKLLDVLSERGRHAIIYGEPGVGKTSIAQILRMMV